MVFKAVSKSNVKLIGYGATFEMNKLDYTGRDYENGEWRMALAIHGCNSVDIEGLTFKNSGGDGIYITSDVNLIPSRNISIRNSVSTNNYRQGMSIISAENLIVEN